jgi:hypothetical protein
METGTSNFYMLWTNVKRLTGHIKLSTSDCFIYQIKSKWEETEKYKLSIIIYLYQPSQHIYMWITICFLQHALTKVITRKFIQLKSQYEA